MQIFEIARKRKINEVNIGAALKGVGSAVGAAAASKIGQAAGVSGDAYANAAGVSQQPSVSGAAAQGTAAKLSAPVIAQQAVAARKMWNQTLTDLMKQSGAQQITQIPIAQRQEQMNNLVVNKLLNRTIKDYHTLPQLVSASTFGGAGQQQAQQAVEDLDNAIKAVLTVDPVKVKPEQTQAAEWQAVVQAAYNIMNIMQFQSATRSPAGALAANPKAAAAMTALGLQATDLAALNAVVRKSGEKVTQGTGSETIDELLKAARLL